METRKTLLGCALTFAAFSCSEAVPPPATMGMTLRLVGNSDVTEQVPSGEHAADASQINLQVSEAKLDMLQLAEDGDDSAQIKCRVKELIKGSSYEISANYIDKTQTTQISLSATTMGGTSAAGYVSIKSAKTGNATYSGQSCAVSTTLPKDGGGAIVASFHCDPSAPLTHQTNCGNPADCDDTLDGDIIFYVKNCGK